MYCGNCGTKNDDTAAFCQSCGAPLRAAQGNPADTAAAPQRRVSDRKVGMIATAVAVVVVLLAGWLLLGGRSYKATVNQLFDAAMDGDAEEILELIPRDVIEQTMEKNGMDRGDIDDLAKAMEMELAGMLSLSGAVTKQLDIDLDVKITGDTDIIGDDLAEIQEEYRAYDVKVSKAKDVSVTVAVNMGGLSESETMEIPVIKVGRSWYLDASSF